MRKILKYTIPFDGKWHIIDMPAAPIISVGNQEDSLVFWLKVSDQSFNSKREFRIYATGEEIKDDDAMYIGTTYFDTCAFKPLVLHLFEKLK